MEVRSLEVNGWGTEQILFPPSGIFKDKKERERERGSVKEGEMERSWSIFMHF